MGAENPRGDNGECKAPGEVAPTADSMGRSPASYGWIVPVGHPADGRTAVLDPTTSASTVACSQGVTGQDWHSAH